jgi:hypothetical protein
VIVASSMTPLAIDSFSATGGAGAGKTPQRAASLNWGINPAARTNGLHAINPQPLPPGE